MKIVSYSPQYRNDLAKLFYDFHNYIVSIHDDDAYIPFTNLDDALLFVDRVVGDAKKGNGFVYLALVDKAPVGFIQGVIHDRSGDKLHKLVAKLHKWGWISEFYVDENYRGKGIGKALMGKAGEFYKANGCTSMRLYVSDTNPLASGFYANYGMKTRGRNLDIKI